MFNFITESPWYNYTLFGNSIATMLGAFGVFLALLVVFYLIQKIVLWRFKKFAEKTHTDIDDTFIRIIESIKPPMYAFVAL